MNKALKINFTLLIIIAILVVFIQQDDDIVEDSKKLTTQDITKITQLSILIPEQHDINLTKNGEEWIITSPFQSLANNQKINQLIQLTQAPVINQYDLPENTSPFGLTQGIKLKFNGKSLSLGKLNPVNKHRYIAIDNQLFLIFDRYSHVLLKGNLGLVTLNPINSLQNIAKIDYQFQQETINEQTVLFETWKNVNAESITLSTEDIIQENIKITLKDNTQLKFYYQAGEPASLVRLSNKFKYILSSEAIQALGLPKQ